MKIGQFAKHNNVSIDTIRHYIDLNLIFPEKISSYYNFDQACQNDFDDLIHLKALGFTLGEISKILLYKRIGNLTDVEKRDSFLSFFKTKYDWVNREIESLLTTKEGLQEAIEKFSESKPSTKRVKGLSLQGLDLLYCPHCQTKLITESGQIVHNTIFNGRLICHGCDEAYQLEIIDGILISTELIPDTAIDLTHLASDASETYIDQYLRSTDSDYLQKLYASLQWSARHNCFDHLKDGDVSLELGSGHGYFLRYHLELFNKDMFYVAVDHDIEKLIWLKSILDQQETRLKILYICSDFKEIPLANQSVDLLLDISGSSNYAFDHTDFLLNDLVPMLKNQAMFHGYYILFEKFAKNSTVALAARSNFKLESVKLALAQLNLDLINEYISPPVTKGGPMENYFVSGESVFTYIVNGKFKPLG
ncbi:MAG: hypothetical protein BGO41_13230 [Clostridiales bacterium 38-18]|nr:MAG: hypothetical protein BGO41_13230 [Clostridiales bacterium 38-18]